MIDPTIQEIQHIQEEAIRALGRDPFEVKRDVADNNNVPVESSPDAFHEALQSLRENKNNIHELDDNVRKEMIEIFKIVAPEKIYLSDHDFLQAMAKPEGTIYDRAPLLQRLVNIEALCHEYYTDTMLIEKQDIILSSLPFIQINGVCFFSSTNKPVTLLNEALLYCVPQLLENFLPFARMKDYRDQIDRFSFISPDEKELKTVIQHVDEITNRHVPKFFMDIISIMSGELMPSEMTYESGAKYLPHAHDTWKMSELLKQEVYKVTKFKPTNAKPSQSENRKRHNYYAARGFFTLIVGHEFSHFYRGHHEKRAEAVCLKSLEHRREALDEFRSHMRNPTIPIQELDSEHYLIQQPTEIEADSDALRCVAKYMVGNNLAGEDLKHVITGALSAFIFMEIVDRIQTLHLYGIEAAAEIRKTPANIRNILFTSEHPSPMTRLGEALAHTNWDGEQCERAKGYMLEEWENMALSIDWIWNTYAPILQKHMKTTGFTPRAQMERSSLFKGFSAIGCFDENELFNYGPS